MSESTKKLQEIRNELDALDQAVIELLQKRQSLSKEVLKTKLQASLPIFVAEREAEKARHFKVLAQERGIDPQWAEDFLRMMMTASRESQSSTELPKARVRTMNIVVVGGGGGMGSLYGRYFSGSGHEVVSIDKKDWDVAPAHLSKADLVIITVPIAATETVIEQVAPLLNGTTILADFTSNKAAPLKTMIKCYDGPVIGLHPMHGPDVKNLTKQLMIICDGRGSKQYQWVVDQFILWGMRTKHVNPVEHDNAMNVVQGLRHFVALMHGSYMKTTNLAPDDILDFSSPIYRAELMMTGRIFAQDAELYADIVFASEERRSLLLRFLEHQQSMRKMVEENDRAGFIEAFHEISAFFGDFAEQALEESSYLINRLADRFA